MSKLQRGALRARLPSHTCDRLVLVKGQRLFVRETTASDEQALSEFYRSEELAAPPSLDGSGVIGRLVGDLVAHLVWSVDGDQATITHVYVVRALRKKRVGRALIQDAVAIARAKNIERLVVSGACPACAFFVHTGFANHEQELVLEVS